MNAADEQDRQPVPRAWREEFDGLKPIRPITYKKKPAAPKVDERPDEPPGPRQR